VELTHVVMFSSGAGSWAAARRVADTHGTDRLRLVFADVKGDNPSPHAGEDEDNYRFLKDAAADIGGELVWLNEGRDIWQVFHDDRFLGNSRLANCSKFLKQRPARQWLEANCDPLRPWCMSGSTGRRCTGCQRFRKAYLPYRAEAPLCEPPYLTREQVFGMLRERGIEPPRLYEAGFPHANCGGFCVRGGQAQMELLLRENPARYRYHEAKEQELREYLGKDVAVLKDRTGGKTVPLTLRRFRERVESQGTFDGLDWGGCGCFTDGEAA
jgi:hypothetical protein